ncbi:MAG: HzsA-related protein, partial [Thermoguttaceae bacterium]
MPLRGRMVLVAATLAMLGAATSQGVEPPAAAPPESPAADLVPRALEAMGGAEEIAFAVRGMYSDGHYYANFGHWSLNPDQMMYAPGGAKLCKLNLRTRQVHTLVDDPQGSLRDPCVHYDGGKILFSYRPGGTRYFHLYEIGTDGTGLRQLTDGPFDDIEPTYLPDGDIIFPSSRCNRFVACWYTPVATLRRLDSQGNIHSLSSNIVHENTPSILPDGRVLYTRWEYVDRAPQKFHGLWTMDPDGANQAILFGNTQPPGKWLLMIDAKPIPGTDRIVAIFSPNHGNREHEGNVMILDAKAGPDMPDDVRQISPVVKMAAGWMGGTDAFRDPYPLSSDCFVVARDKSLVILDDAGRTEDVYQAEMMLHEPCVIGPRKRERSGVPRTDPAATTGRLVVADVHHGQNLEGVEPGQIKRLLVLEQLPRPVAFSGVQQTLSMNGSHTLKRILGTVPVESDGSAYFEAPALRSLYFVALDEQGRTVKRMQSFCTVMPGETISCVGCHEKRMES